MHFQLREIILWSRDPRRPPRRLPFQTGQVNVITGGSKTGKSAIIPIVDYCLGSDKCAIPVERIRKASSWFGVLIETREGQQLLARREPGQQRASGEMFVRRGKTVEVPNSIDTGNTTADQVKRDLDQLAGLTNLGFDPEGKGGPQSQQSCRLGRVKAEPSTTWGENRAIKREHWSSTEDRRI